MKTTKDSARPRRSMAGVVIACVVLGGWGACGYYSYTGTVIHPMAQKDQRSLLPSLRVEAYLGQRGRVVDAYLSLANVTRERIRLLDPQALAPVYELHVSFRPEKGGQAEEAAFTPSHIELARLTSRTPPKFDRARDAIVELVPGSALTRRIPLSELYELQRNGHYEISVTYKPEPLVQSSGSDLSDLGICQQHLIATAGFDLQPPAPAKTPVETDAPQAPPAPEAKKAR
ncbi:MAG TPA: hypothetical protein VGP72_14155 [Planctomycetota bacterium]|jgi:hypothetical protein